MEMREPRNRAEQIQQIREDRDLLAASVHELTGWMREARLKRIAELDAVLAKLANETPADHTPPQDDQGR
jgi:hypothetical protein